MIQGPYLLQPARTLWSPLLHLAIALCLVLACSSTSGRADELPSEYYHDFRTKPLPPELTYFNADDGSMFRQEPEGLRITIPKTMIHPWGGVGFRTSFGFKGDFEVTTTYEILQAEAPPAGGFGVGVCLYVAKPGTAGGSSLARLVRAGDTQVVFWDFDRGEGAPKPRWDGGMDHCADKVGRLRMKRTGTMLHHLWASGTQGDDFKEINQSEFGDDEIARVRLCALTGRQPCDVSVRLLDLRIRSQSMDQPVPVAVPRRQSVWWAVALVIVLSLGVFLAVRTSRRAGKQPGHAGAEPQPAADEPPSAERS
jgi:hypothetical protein